MSTDTLIADRIEIADLFARFQLLLDEKRWQDADTVFTDDVAVHSPRGGELRGIDKVVGFMRQGDVEGQQAQHTTTDLLRGATGHRVQRRPRHHAHPARPGPRSADVPCGTDTGADLHQPTTGPTALT